MRATPAGSPRSVFSCLNRTLSPAACGLLLDDAELERRRDLARAQHVHADALVAQLRLQRHAQAVHAALARTVGDGAASPRHARSGRDHHDNAAVRRAYRGDGVLGRQEAPLEIDIDRVVPHLLGDVLDRHHRVARDPRRRHQAVDAAHKPRGLFHESAHLGLIGHVGLHEPGLAARSGYLGDAVHTVRLVHVRDHDPGAHCGAVQGRRTAYARGSARDYDSSAFQVYSLHLIPASTPVL